MKTWATTLLAITLILALTGCSVLSSKRTKTYIVRANVSDVTRHGDGSMTMTYVVWHVGPLRGQILPSTRIHLHMKDHRELFDRGREPIVGATYNFLIDQTVSDGELRFGNMRFAPRGSQEKIPMAKPPYATAGHEIRIEQ